MNLTNLQRQWQHAAVRRELKVTIPFIAELEDGDRVTAEVLVEGYGASRGMLIVSDYAAVERKTDSIVQSGFGFSCMSQPAEADVSSIEALEVALQDWGICTSDEEKA